MISGRHAQPVVYRRHAKAHYEGELKLRRLNNDDVGAMEWDWVWSLLQGKQSSATGVLQEEVLEKAQQQVSSLSWVNAKAVKPEVQPFIDTSVEHQACCDL